MERLSELKGRGGHRSRERERLCDKMGYLIKKGAAEREAGGRWVLRGKGEQRGNSACKKNIRRSEETQKGGRGPP